MQPPKYKSAVIIWLAIYPLITLVLWLGGPYLVQIPLALRTLLLTVVLVPTMVYVLVPFWQKVLQKWLQG